MTVLDYLLVLKFQILSFLLFIGTYFQILSDMEKGVIMTMSDSF